MYYMRNNMGLAREKKSTELTVNQIVDELIEAGEKK